MKECNTDSQFSQEPSANDSGLVVESKRGGGHRWENPSEGAHQAVLSEVRDMGLRPTSFGPKPRVRLVWKIADESGSNGETLRAFQTFTKSWHERSHLRRNVRAILGRDPGDKYNLRDLIGSRATLHIEHHSANGQTFANVVAITRPAGGGQ